MLLEFRFGKLVIVIVIFLLFGAFLATSKTKNIVIFGRLAQPTFYASSYSLQLISVSYSVSVRHCGNAVNIFSI